jgi:hypothetical protein
MTRRCSSAERGTLIHVIFFALAEFAWTQISRRNVLIYMNPDLQGNEVHRRFPEMLHAALAAAKPADAS